MGLSFKITIPDLQQLATGLDGLDQQVIDAWNNDANTLLQIEIYNVAKRTQERAYKTGALMSSVTGSTYAGSKNGSLVSVWFNASQQIAEWGRYYAPYQEGEPMGLHTYTNEPRHMLYDAQFDDIPQITTWATSTGQAGVDSLTSSLNALPTIDLGGD